MTVCEHWMVQITRKILHSPSQSRIIAKLRKEEAKTMWQNAAPSRPHRKNEPPLCDHDNRRRTYFSNGQKELVKFYWTRLYFLTRLRFGNFTHLGLAWSFVNSFKISTCFSGHAARSLHTVAPVQFSRYTKNGRRRKHYRNFVRGCTASSIMRYLWHTDRRDIYYWKRGLPAIRPCLRPC